MNLKDSTREELVEEMKKVCCRDEEHEKMSCAIIDCEIPLVEFGKLIKFHRFNCFSYSETSNGITGLLYDKTLKLMFHFTATKNHILLYPSKNKDYNPESFVDFYIQIHKSIDRRARLFMYEEYQIVKKREEESYQKYKAEKEKEEYESGSR